MVIQQNVRLRVSGQLMVTQQRVGLRGSGQYGNTAKGRVKDVRTIW